MTHFTLFTKENQCRRSIVSNERIKQTVRAPPRGQSKLVTHKISLINLYSGYFLFEILLFFSPGNNWQGNLFPLFHFALNFFQ